jgi:hypothetical protein
VDELADEQVIENKKYLQSLLPYGKNGETANHPFSHHDSLASNTNRSDKSKRA